MVNIEIDPAPGADQSDETCEALERYARTILDHMPTDDLVAALRRAHEVTGLVVEDTISEIFGDDAPTGPTVADLCDDAPTGPTVADLCDDLGADRVLEQVHAWRCNTECGYPHAAATGVTGRTQRAICAALFAEVFR